MTTLLTDNLPLLAGAPNGSKKLRELILELAVRGKLVPQDPNDEPASELLKRIAEEKARLVAEGKIKKQKPLAAIAEEEKLFELPTSWVWGRLNELTLKITDGTHHSPTNTPSGDYKYISAKNIKSWGIDLTEVTYVTNEIHQEIFSRCDPSKGDILYIKDGATTGIATINPLDEPFSMLSSVALLKPSGGLHNEYMLKAMVSPVFYREMRAGMTGVAITRVTLAKLNNAVIPLPPLAEQHRIVAKVDELMALCDRLEAHQADAESAHAQLVRALLDSLTQASDATDFVANWQRLAEHFHTLFNTESSIDALMQTLLQLAVMGKLVPQHPSDEPASELLNRVTEERSRLVAEGQLKKQKSLPEVGEEEKSYALPSNWKWVRFDSVSNTRLGKMLDKAKNKGELRPYLRNTNVQWFNFEIDDLKSMRFEEHELNEYRVIPGDLVICEGGEPGRCAVWQGDVEDMFIQKALHRARPWLGISPFFLQFCLRAAAHSGFLDQFFTGATIKHFSGEKLAKYPVPLPPLAEQHRIVAKVDQLIALCDQLKTRLTQARQLNEQLASTLVERALAKDGQQALVARDPKGARTLLAAEITHQLHGQRTFGQRKLQKVIYLAEHAARLAAIQGDYLRNVAGPHDRQLMTQVETELQNNEWYERIERETKGHAYRPLSKAGQHRQAYSSTWSGTKRTTIEQVIELMRDWDTDRCEMTVTLYAAWNDFIIEGRPVTDDAIVNEVLHRWNDAKLRFSKSQWLAVLAEMKKHSLLTPSGFGKRTTGGTLTLPGFE
ncbi:restriction endonuclease subunit S [Pseudomonas sp. PDM12]|uniref:restriction endonuclease subunit S n=1 Tax=Pseudomonas sp. PDM12 TaxID=2769260 RepID=UPI0017815401|nr:restriction endonuclease subunit S [Pseudomonas sp. PDM12]MBD9654776.1 restriction endonuclease subunit S [Pseudomonas sp. PDM12]